jgi:hypothetical protein
MNEVVTLTVAIAFDGRFGKIIASIENLQRWTMH